MNLLDILERLQDRYRSDDPQSFWEVWQFYDGSWIVTTRFRESVAIHVGDTVDQALLKALYWEPEP